MQGAFLVFFFMSNRENLTFNFQFTPFLNILYTNSLSTKSGFIFISKAFHKNQVLKAGRIINPFLQFLVANM